jgi:TRAP transporter TAXI family solute receptor
MNIIKQLALSAIGTSLLLAGPLQAEDTFVSIGSNPVGNTAYQWAAGISDLVNRNVDGVQMTAEGTKGYVANVRLMLDGKIEAGFSNSKLAYEAYKGEGDYKGTEPGQILSWMSIAPIVLHAVVLDDSNIKSLSDLKGKRVGIGQPGGTSMLDAEILMDALGLTPGESFKDFRVRLPQMVDMLSDRQIDAFVWNGSIPLPPIIKLKSKHKVRILPVPTEIADAIRTKYPAYTSGNLPANTYADQPDEVPSYRLGNVLLIRADVPDEIVYQATKVVMENLKHMAGVHPAWKRVSAKSILGGFQAPLHPGALRYYREAGVPGIEEFAARTAK